MPKRFDLIVFDWDGTLADSTQMIVECIRQASAEAGLPVPEPAAASNIIGLGLREAIAVLFGSLSDSQYELLTARATAIIILPAINKPCCSKVRRWRWQNSNGRVSCWQWRPARVATA